MTFKYLLHIVFLLCVFNSINAQVYYVSSGAVGTGTSWSDASGDLSTILNNASAGSQVWVASGIYYPVQCSACSEEQRDMPFEVSDSVEVYGGFVGNETNLNQRDWENNVTILSGDIDQNGILDGNAGTILQFTRVSNMTILDGFSLVDGYAINPLSGDGERENSGAAIYNQGGLDGSHSHPLISNCIFSNNTAAGFGGAICNNGSYGGNANPIFENCIFLNNTSQQGGGAIYNQASFSGSALPIYSNCTFENNIAIDGSGGAIYNQGAENGDCNPSFLNCHFIGNSTSDYGGGVYCHGRKGRSNPIFENCIFEANEANFGGGSSNNGTTNGESNAIYTDCIFENNHVLGDGGGVFNWGANEGLSNASFFDCIFRNNNSDFAGAGLFNNGINGTANATVLNCQFISNVATTYGGAMYNHGKNGNASATITNCLIANNYGSSAGGVYNLGSSNGNASPRITNCTFYGNTANVGGAVYNNASDSTGTSSPIITNCVFWKNEANFGRVFRNVLGTPFIQYSVVDEPDCTSMNSGIGSMVTCGEGIIFNVYPEFEDTLGGDFRLKPNSLILDLGHNLTIDTTGIDFDLDHQNRIFNNVVDLGAYEYFDDYLAPVVVGQPVAGMLCAEESLSLNVIASGTPPLSYQWYKDGVSIVSATDSIFEIAVVNIADAGNYLCKVMSLMGDTAVSEIANIIVDPLTFPSIEIEATDLEICEGETIVFNTSSSAAGNTPTYTWYQNGVPLTSALDSISIDNLDNGDEIIVELNSSLNCVESVNAYDTVFVEVAPMLEVAIDITGPDSVVCLGNEAKFIADFSNSGTNPSLQWMVNGNEISGQTNNEFISYDLENDDLVVCNLISSEACAIENSVSSNGVVLAIDSCATTNVLQVIDDQKIQLLPNPSDGIFYLKAFDLDGDYTISIVDIAGKIMLQRDINLSNNFNNIKLSIANSGIYFVKIYNKSEFSIQRVIINKK